MATLSIFQPSVPGPVGPGYVIGCTISAGPNPTDDYVDVRLAVSSFPGIEIAAGFHKCSDGNLSQIAVIGLWEFFPSTFSGRPNFGLSVPISAGTVVDLNVRWKHANGAVVAAKQLAGCTWDPINGLFALISYELWGLSPGFVDLSTLLARTFPDN